MGQKITKSKKEGNPDNDENNNNEDNEKNIDDDDNDKDKSKSKEKEVKLDKIEQMLSDTYQSTDIDFSYKEVLTIKLRVHDAEVYFVREFNCLIYFNSYVFQQRLNILYENYSANAERFLKKNIEENRQTNFQILVDFDDETEMPQGGYYSGNYEINGEGNIVEPNEEVNVTTYSNKIEYESLFTIIFEPLEIPTALFFLMTNHNQKTLSDFFPQLYENIYLNKGNRKFDIMYFLLPNLDYFIRNETYVLYIVNQSNQFDESLEMLSNHTISYSSPFTEAVYCSLYFKELLRVNYDINNFIGNSMINAFLKNIIAPSFIQCVFKFDLNFNNFDDFITQYERELELINLVISLSNVNTLVIRLDNFSQVDKKIEYIIQLIKKFILMNDKIQFNKSVLIVRLVCLEKFDYKNKEKEKLTIKLNEIINDLVKESLIFSNRERLRKILIECFYYEKEKDKKEDITDDLNTSNENLTAKKGTKVQFKKEKIYYTYFLPDKQIKKMKKYIYNILLKKIKDKKIFANIFQLLFDKKYYLHNLTGKYGKDTQYKVEKMFYI